MGLLGLLVLLSGCDVPPAPPGYPYAQAPYPPPPYPPSAYPPSAYPPPPYAAYPGYSYNDGAPTIIEGGVAVPLIFFGGQWGFYDRYHRWHRAPDAVYRDLEAHRAARAQFRPGTMPGPGGPPPGAPPNWRPPPQGVPGGYRPPPPGVGRPPPPPEAGRPPPEAGRPPPPPGAGRPPPAPAAAQAPARPEGRPNCPPGQRC